MVDFDMVLDSVKEEPVYSKEETIEYLRPFIEIVLHYPLNEVLHPEAVDALKKRLKANMDKYLDEIKLSEVLVVPEFSKEHKDAMPARRKKAPRIDYDKAAELMIEFLLENPHSSYREIKAYLNTHADGLTPSQWQRLRQIFDERGSMEYKGKKYKLLHEGDKSKTRWWVEPV